MYSISVEQNFAIMLNYLVMYYWDHNNMSCFMCDPQHNTRGNTMAHLTTLLYPVQNTIQLKQRGMK